MQEREKKQLNFEEETKEFTKRFTTIKSQQKLKRKLRNSQWKICNKTQQLRKTLEFIEKNANVKKN
jgi:hypothetical protein